MPIPDFDHNYVLPPHLGNPVDKSHLSPYPCTVLELCNKFSTSTERIEILKKYITFRQKMTANGIVYGFQWLDGSFMEDVEKSQGRSPRDLDIVTFYGGLGPDDLARVSSAFPEFASTILSKNNFCLDHYAVDYSFNPNTTVEMTRYWLQLFTHNRLGVWKGILRLPLNTPIDDEQGLAVLNSLK